MAPTLKDSSADSSPSDSSRVDARNSQPVALDVPVTVNGARAIPGTNKREPFSENTSTVLVHSNGAVIRLTSAVQPGQLLFLTNEKTRKEVVCQVVKSKSDRNSGYVELQFTEPVSGFWGLRFPNEKSTPSVPSGVAQIAAVSQKPAMPSPVLEKNSAPVPLAKPKIAEQFKSEIKPEARHLSKADLLAPSESSTQAPKLDSSPLQEQLAALLAMDSIAEEPGPPKPAASLNAAAVAAQVLEIADTPAVPPTVLPTVSATVEAAPLAEEPPAPAIVPPPEALPPAPKSSFEDDEVKIPAWLQPLARNESVPAPPSTHEDTLPPTQDSTVTKTEAPPPIKRHEPAHKAVSSAAVFGNSLIGETPAPVRSSSNSSKGMWIGAVAAVLMVGAGAAWYFRETLFVSQTTAAKPQIATTSPAPGTAPAVISDAVTSPSSPATDSTSLDPSSQAPKPSAASIVPDSRSSSAPPKLQSAAISERIPKTPAAEAKTPANENEESHIFVVEPEKRPSLGNVRLKKPKVGHASETNLKPELEPSLEGAQPAISGDSINSGLVAANAKEPSAPTPRAEAGGEVRVARMISSVAPVYPALAKAQHISGEVRIDALIDATGRVSAMKVVSGPTLLHQAAMDALRQWKYQPATLDGKPVSMHLTVTIQFRLQQ